jgi:hypothetical protein
VARASADRWHAALRSAGFQPSLRRGQAQDPGKDRYRRQGTRLATAQRHCTCHQTCKLLCQSSHPRRGPVTRLRPWPTACQQRGCSSCTANRRKGERNRSASAANPPATALASSLRRRGTGKIWPEYGAAMGQVSDNDHFRERGWASSDDMGRHAGLDITVCFSGHHAPGRAPGPVRPPAAAVGCLVAGGIKDYSGSCLA